MNIAVNTRFLIRDKIEGIGKVTAEVLSRLVDLMPEDQFTFIFDRPFDKRFLYRSDITPKVIPPPARHPVLIRTWLQWGVRKYLRKARPDVFLSFDGFAPLNLDIPAVITIHDLAYIHYPEQNRRADLNFYRRYMPRFAREANHIITVSEYSRQDICRHLDVSAGKVSVIYNGVNHAYHPPDDGTRQSARQTFAGGAPYFLYVGAIHPRKNVDGLIRAFSIYRKGFGGNEKLVITGRRGWLTGAVQEAYQASPYREDILFTDYVPQPEMPKLVAGARALVYVSFFEGFGLPILEAMATGVPVICSDRNAMAEVAGTCAFLVDPDSPDQVAFAMDQTGSAQEKTRQMVACGLKRAAEFTWERAAVQYRDVLLGLAGHR